MTDKPDIGRVIRRERKRAGLTQRELSEVVGIAQSNIGSMEAGIVRDPSFQTVMRVCEALGISPWQLYGGPRGDKVGDVSSELINGLALEIAHQALYKVERRVQHTQAAPVVEALNVVRREVLSVLRRLVGDYDWTGCEARRR